MADKFYDGMTNVNEELNRMNAAFEKGPFNALPLTGGSLTGQVTSSSSISMARRAPSVESNSYSLAGWYLISSFTALYGGEARITVSGASPYSNADVVTIILRRDNDGPIRGAFHSSGTPNSATVSNVKIDASGGIYALCKEYSVISVYCDSNMTNRPVIAFLGAGVSPPSTAIDATPVWCLKVAGKDALTVTPTDIGVGARLLPTLDNAYDIGQASTAFRTIYARTGTINTSDARLKCDFRDLSAAESAAARDIARAIGAYRWRDAVDDKGNDAREHIGPTVQRAIEIMQGHGLDPFNYGFICHDEWDQESIEHPAIEARPAVPATEAAPEVLDGLGNVMTPAKPANAGHPAIEARAAYTEVTLEAGDRYAFRYDELAMFIATGQEARLAALEAA